MVWNWEVLKAGEDVWSSRGLGGGLVLCQGRAGVASQSVSRLRALEREGQLVESLGTWTLPGLQACSVFPVQGLSLK